MKLFFVKSEAVLKLPHKSRQLRAPSPEQLQSLQIPADRLYCGNVVWEVLMARKQLGADNVVGFTGDKLPTGMLPPRVRDFDSGGHFLDHVRPGVKKVRIALLNGFGTMLGDTVLGCGALMCLDTLLSDLPFELEFHAYTSWNARPGVEKMLKSCPRISAVQDCSPTLAQLKSYDAYIDFSSLLTLADYGQIYLIDFYLKHLGIDPSKVPEHIKKPWFGFDEQLKLKASELIHQNNHRGAPALLIHPKASTPLRSMPTAFTRRLIQTVIEQTQYMVVFAVQPEFELGAFGDRVIDLSSWSAQSLQHLGGIVQAVNAVVSVDTLVIHLANASNQRAVDILTASDPCQSVPKTGLMKGMLIPGATELPGWMKHKAPENWNEIAPKYERAWSKFDDHSVVKQLLDLQSSPV